MELYDELGNLTNLVSLDHYNPRFRNRNSGGCLFFVQLIGNTPLVYLNKVIYGYMGRVSTKLESMEPCSSFRDKTWYYIIIYAEKGFIVPGKVRGGRLGLLGVF